MAFLDGYDHFRTTAISRLPSAPASTYCAISKKLPEGDALSLSYIPIASNHIHNSNTLGASLLARTYSYNGNESDRSLAQKAMLYTANHQTGEWILVLR